MDGEIMKKCLVTAAETMMGSKDAKIFNTISLSRNTVTARTESLSVDINSQLNERINDFIAYSLAVDESTDLVDTAQLAIFIRGVNKNLEVTEQLLSICSMKGTTKGEDILRKVKGVIDERQLDLSKLTAIATDGAPAMMGSRIGFTSLLLSEMRDKQIQPLPYAFHCIIHQENLAAKTLKMEHVMRVVNGVVKDIRKKGLNHRQFRHFLKEIDAAYEDVPYFSEVRWLSRGKMMSRVYDLRSEILQFYDQKDMEIEEFTDEQFMNDFAFIVDMLSHLNELNTKLQGNGQLISDLYHYVGGFDGRLGLWKADLACRSVDREYFPKLHSRSLMDGQNLDLDKYSQLITVLKDEFEIRFQDFKDIQAELCLFSAPLHVEEDVPASLRIELIDLKHDLIYSPMFVPGGDLIQAYRSLPLRYTRLRALAARYFSMFGSTYVCEKLFSTMSYAKNKYRTRLTDLHLSDILTLTTSQIEPNWEKLTAGIQCQPSH